MDMDSMSLGPVQTLMQAAALRPDDTAMTFVDYATDRAGVASSFSYRELDQGSAAVAASMMETVDRGSRVAILCGHDVDYVISFLACLRAGMIAVPLFAPEPFRPQDRLVNVLADCDPEIVLTATGHLEAVQKLLTDLPGLPKEVLPVDVLRSIGIPAQGPLPTLPDGDVVAYLQYTSGSTRKPAGVQVLHRNLTVGAHQLAAAVEIGQSSRLVSWLPFFHDMGLMFSLAVSLATTTPVTCFSPLAFIQQPRRWLELLTTQRATHTMSPNFGLDLCADRVKGPRREGLDLSALRVLGNGSEHVRPDTLARFTEAFEPVGFRHSAHCPGYGLAEATLVVTADEVGKEPVVGVFDRAELSGGRVSVVDDDDPNGQRLVSAGRPVQQEVRIVTPETGSDAPVTGVGEIWVRGANVCGGYWQQPERSLETFVGRNAEDGWLRTGDVGFLLDGRLYVAGRLRDLIIVDGRNHHPADIEMTVEEASDGLRAGRVAAFGCEVDEREALVVVAELAAPASALDLDAVRRTVRAAVSERHEVRVHDIVLVRKGAVPVTSSGKLRRQECKSRYERGEYQGAA